MAHVVSSVTRVEKDFINYGIGGSLAVHLLLCVLAAFWINHRILISLPKITPKPEPEVTLIFPEAIKPEPPIKPKAEPERYIRTTQNDPATAPPMKADFVSDKNTVASAKNAPDPKGDTPMPTMTGINIPTRELANRDYKDGKIKNDSAPSPPPAAPVAPLPKPQMRAPEPVMPKQQVVKKEEAAAEKMLLDAAATSSQKKNESSINKATPAPPAMKVSQDDPPVPKAIPVATPIMNTPRAERDAFQPETHIGSAKGTISNRGTADSVNAAETPSGRYMRQVTSAIEKRWHFLAKLKADFVTPGKLRLHFFVEKNGKVRPDPKIIVFNEANAIVADFTLNALFEAEIPPIPKDLLPMLDKERFEVDYDIVIY